jgi:hypothetical protein
VCFISQADGRIGCGISYWVLETSKRLLEHIFNPTPVE